MTRQFTLLDIIKNTKGIKNKTGLIEYKSLPQGVKRLSCRKYWFFSKQWFIDFAGELDFCKLETICKEKNCSLITGNPAVSDEQWENLKCFMKRFSKDPVFIDNIDLLEPNIRYRIYDEIKEIIVINWTKQMNTLSFCTGCRNGLKLTEEYRRYVFEK